MTERVRDGDSPTHSLSSWTKWRISPTKWRLHWVRSVIQRLVGDPSFQSGW